MSNFGQALLMVVGTVIGAYFGNPQLGLMLGSLAGNLIFPTELPAIKGSRLEDIGATNSNIGAPIPKGWGVFPASGNVIWQSDLREVVTKEEVGGKGGGSQTVETVTYFQDFAIGLCEGEIVGIRRIWANGKLIYDRKNLRSIQDILDDLIDNIWDIFAGRLAASTILDDNMVVYTGTETQMPDPTIESHLGVDLTSGFRGLAYVVFINWEMKPEDGNRMPGNWLFEVVERGQVVNIVPKAYSTEVLYPWLTSASNPYNQKNLHEIRVLDCPPARRGNEYTTLNEALNATNAAMGFPAAFYIGYTVRPTGGDYVVQILSNYDVAGAQNVGQADAYAIGLHYNKNSPNKIKEFRSINPPNSGGSDKMVLGGDVVEGDIMYTNGYFCRYGATYSWFVGGNYNAASQYAQSRPEWDGAVTSPAYLSPTPGGVLVSRSAVYRVQRIPSKPPNPCVYGPAPGLPGYGVSDEGTLVKCGEWTKNTVGDWKVLQRYAVSSDNGTGRDAHYYPAGLSSAWKVTRVSRYPLNPTRPSSHADYNNQPFWEAAYAKAVADGSMPSGLVYNVDYPRVVDYGYEKENPEYLLDGDEVPIAEIIHDLHIEAGDLQENFDVTDLEATENPGNMTVPGYVRTRTQAARAAIEPLRSIGFFDAYESQGVLTYVRRGKPTVETLSTDELGAGIEGEQAKTLLRIRKRQDIEIPRTVRVRYMSEARDYGINEQLSPTRTDVLGANEADLDLVAVLSDNRAAQIAEVIWADLWASRWTYETSVDQSFTHLEPTDCLSVSVDGESVRMRIVSIVDQLPSIRKLEMVRDDDGAYISHAIAATSFFTSQDLTIIGPTQIVYLDIPKLREEDEDVGIYVAAFPLIVGQDFQPTIMMRSADNGASYVASGTLASATVGGYTLGALATGPTETWDEINTLQIALSYGTLESRTEDEVLGGANTFALGIDGRWMIGQFKNAALIGDNVWEISGLLQGRRGTEHFVGTSITDDTFVMVSTGTIIRLPGSDLTAGQSRLYKPVPVGVTIGSIEPQSFTTQGIALKPFSPVLIEGYVDEFGNLNLFWYRRDRSLTQEFSEGGDIPMSENALLFDVEVYEGGVLIAEELNVPNEFTTLPITGAGVYEIRVYQISAQVGRGTPGIETITPGNPPDFFDFDINLDAGAIILPLVGDENDRSGTYVWTRNGDGPRITPEGMLGDGYQARLLATASLPAFLTSPTGPLTMRATAAIYNGARNSTRDVIVSCCENDASPDPKLELGVIDDPNLANEPITAFRGDTGTIQVQPMCRRNWKFEFTHPEKIVGGQEARPMAIMEYSPGFMLISAHYNSALSRVHLVNRDTGETNGYFDFPPEYGWHRISSIRRRASDDSMWFIEHETGNLLKVDVPSSLITGTAVVQLVYDLSAANILSGMDWVEIDGTEYFCFAEYRTSGTPYIYLLDPVLIINGNTFVDSEREKRLSIPLRNQGIVYRAGELFSMHGTSPSGTTMSRWDFDEWVINGADNDAYTVYEDLLSPTTRPVPGPALWSEDLGLDSDGRIWCPTGGYDSAEGDDDAFLCFWSTNVDELYQENTYQFDYDGAGSLDIFINDKLFVTKAWTLSATTVAAITVGGPPTAADGQTNGFFVGHVRNIVIQDQPLTLVDPENEYIWSFFEPPTVWEVGITNPDAETGDSTGWTDELGDFRARQIADLNSGPVWRGTYFFDGGPFLETKAYQLVNIAETTGLTPANIDVGNCWAITRWMAADYSSHNDQSAFGFRFYDEDDVLISTEMPTLIAPSPGDVWIVRTYGVLIPVGTRTFDLFINQLRNTGTNNNAHMDDLQAFILQGGGDLTS